MQSSTQSLPAYLTATARFGVKWGPRCPRDEEAAALTRINRANSFRREETRAAAQRHADGVFEADEPTL